MMLNEIAAAYGLFQVVFADVVESPRSRHVPLARAQGTGLSQPQPDKAEVLLVQESRGELAGGGGPR